MINNWKVKKCPSSPHPNNRIFFNFRGVCCSQDYLRWDNPEALNGRHAGGGGKLSLIGLGDTTWDRRSELLGALMGVARGESSFGGGLKLWQSGCGVTVRNETSSPILRQFSLEFDGLWLLWLPCLLNRGSLGRGYVFCGGITGWATVTCSPPGSTRNVIQGEPSGNRCSIFTWKEKYFVVFYLFLNKEKYICFH